MPTTYTHDLFGKKVYRQLPEEIRKVIRENGNLFRIGLHGPDILFYDLFNQKVCGLEMCIRDSEKPSVRRKKKSEAARKRKYN